jgi:hypothetical protein
VTDAAAVITLAHTGLVMPHEGTIGRATGARQAVTSDDLDPPPFVTPLTRIMLNPRIEGLP